MSKHTPGPWTLYTAPTVVGSCHKIGPFPSGRHNGETYACVYADGCRIGVDDNIPNAVELHANARLIAAAPDLLAAAKAALAYDAAIQDCADSPTRMASFCTAEGDDLDTLYAEWISASRAAIAAATGDKA